MNYYIITGTSRGLGEALAQRLMSDNNYLFCISRNSNEQLVAQAKQKNCLLEYVQYDLESIEGIDELVAKIFKYIDLNDKDLYKI